MVTDVGPVYEGSDGRYYTDWQVRRKLDAGEWRPCLRERGTGRRLVATADGSLVMLVPTPLAALPEWVEVRAAGRVVRAVDTRRSIP